MRHLSPALLSAGLLAASTAIAAEPVVFSEATLPHEFIRRAHTAINIDGKLDEFVWSAAPQINTFHRVTVGQEFGDIPQVTRARMVWDDEALYFAFTCRDTDIWAIYTDEDDRMWSEEVVEVFIDPDGDGRDYLEFQVNPLNAHVDLHIISLNPWDSSIEWDIDGVRNAVDVIGTVNDSSDTDVGWTAEIAIPWPAFLPQITGGERPQVGDMWRLNLYRIERGAGAGVRQQIVDLRTRITVARQQMESAADTTVLARQVTALQEELASLARHYALETDYTAWSPTLSSGFHNPSRFGIVEFAP